TPPNPGQPGKGRPFSRVLLELYNDTGRNLIPPKAKFSPEGRPTPGSPLPVCLPGRPGLKGDTPCRQHFTTFYTFLLAVDMAGTALQYGLAGDRVQGPNRAGACNEKTLALERAHTIAVDAGVGGRAAGRCSGNRQLRAIGENSPRSRH